MSSHLDADAFVSAILRNPAEVTGRLAFADWLEEQGGVPNLAWAWYVRSHIEIETLEAQGKKCGLLRHEAAGHVPYIKATVNIPASAIAATHDAFTRIVPASHITVTIGDWTIPRAVYESMPVVFGFGSTVIPLSCRGRSVVVATHAPDHPHLLNVEREHDIEITALRGRKRELEGVLLSLIPDVMDQFPQQG